jgi:hypothetical protein
LRFGRVPGSKEKSYKFRVLVKVIMKGIFFSLQLFCAWGLLIDWPSYTMTGKLLFIEEMYYYSGTE